MADGRCPVFGSVFFLSQSETPKWCSVVFPPFLLTKKKLVGNAVSEHGKKNIWEKTRGVFVDDLSLRFKNPSKTR